MKSGSGTTSSPGARILWMVTMKFRPVRIDEKPVMKTPTAVTITLEFE
jgi:CO dehydrogenase/acetyl-CoA synthase delta subunit